MSEPTNGHLPQPEKLLATGATQERAKRGQTRYKVAQLLDLQELVYLRAKQADIKTRDLTSCVREFVTADKQVMARKGQPVPKPAEVQPKGKSKSTPVPRVVD